MSLIVSFSWTEICNQITPNQTLFCTWFSVILCHNYCLFVCFLLYWDLRHTPYGKWSLHSWAYYDFTFSVLQTNKKTKRCRRLRWQRFTQEHVEVRFEFTLPQRYTLWSILLIAIIAVALMNKYTYFYNLVSRCWREIKTLRESQGYVNTQLKLAVRRYKYCFTFLHHPC